jgi:hypothetical protein
VPRRLARVRASAVARLLRNARNGDNANGFVLGWHDRFPHPTLSVGE